MRGGRRRRLAYWTAKWKPRRVIMAMKASPRTRTHQIGAVEVPAVRSALDHTGQQYRQAVPASCTLGHAKHSHEDDDADRARHQFGRVCKSLAGFATTRAQERMPSPWHSLTQHGVSARVRIHCCRSDRGR
jgi:hypothetical protein